MPFGLKPDPSGGPPIDFDRVYEQALQPAIEAAEMEPVRADEERTGGIIHTPMFERLLLCDYVIADLTTANANVFYELGVRHTARPATTFTIYARHQPIPFDVNFLRSMPYDLGDDNAFGTTEADALRKDVTGRLTQLREVAIETEAVDSPLFQLLTDWTPGDIARLKTDIFRDRVRANEEVRAQLTAVREKGKKKDSRPDALTDLATVRGDLGPLDGVEVGTLVDVLLTHRALEDWDGMIALYGDFPETLKRQVLVREQLGFAYNRRAGTTKNPADRAEALRILQGVEEQQGPSSETCGLIGRIYKDMWEESLAADDEIEAEGHLEEAIDSYRRGFLADQRDAYPGINLVTLLELSGFEDSLAEKDRMLPVVRFAVERRLEASEPDYWDHATMLELAALDDDEQSAKEHHRRAARAIRETWEPGTTARNLRLILEARAERGVEQPWLDKIVVDLEGRAE
jgi:hypothetical protein